MFCVCHHFECILCKYPRKGCPDARCELQLTGEDPDAIPDEPLPKRRHSESDSPKQSHKQHRSHQDEAEQQQRPAAAEGGGPGGRLADAWQAPGSLFSLLTSAEAAGGAAAATDDKDSKKKHKEHKHKKEKHKKKDKVGARLGWWEQNKWGGLWAVPGIVHQGGSAHRRPGRWLAVRCTCIVISAHAHSCVLHLYTTRVHAGLGKLHSFILQQLHATKACSHAVSL